VQIEDSRSRIPGWVCRLKPGVVAAALERFQDSCARPWTIRAHRVAGEKASGRYGNGTVGKVDGYEREADRCSGARKIGMSG
jgi:hypothetical protein